MIFSVDIPIQNIRRILPAYQKRLLKLGIKTLRDLLYHFPFRYDDFSHIKKIADLKLNETATIQGKIVEIKNTRTWRKRMFVTEAFIQDSTGIIKAVWFNQPYLTNIFKQNDIVSLAGKINFDKELYLSNPAYEKMLSSSSPQRKRGIKWGDENQAITSPSLSPTEERKKISLCHTGGLIPVYPETTGLSSRWLRYIIKTFLPKILPQIKDFLPLEIKRNQGLLDLAKALEQIHFPKTKKHAEAARRRLAFDELFLIQLFVSQQKSKWQKQTSPRIPFNQVLIKNFVGSLPFKLTNAQRKTAWEILQDLAKPKPMNRLLEGDVGSGKTVVAAMAALEVAKAGWQVALMAPTEILAQQHFREVTKLLIRGFDITVGLLTSSDIKICGAAERGSAPDGEASLRSASLLQNKFKDAEFCQTVKRKELLEKISAGQIQILIGTHALIQETVQFKNLALVIVDEQHRFGVAQRAALQKSVTQLEDGSPATIPHLLSLTATPIPRTLALTIYGDLDISLLDEMPKDRQEIITKIVAPTNRAKAYEFIRQQVRQGRQVFVICPRIEASNENRDTTSPIVSSFVKHQTFYETSYDQRQTLNDRRRTNWNDVKAVKEEYQKLTKIVFPDLRIAILHGRMKSKEKEKIMLDFKAGKIDILVSTSVIEVGIDVPNATVMMVEGADRFGLAQLHQFRGRVGRGPHQSYCFLFTESSAKNTAARLKALITCKNGFELAEKDLQIRGPGEFYGGRQWGLPDLSMASLSDMTLVKAVREEAQKIIQKDPELKNYPLLKEKLKKFQATIHLE